MILHLPSEFIMAGQPTPLTYPPPRNKGFIAGLIKGNQWSKRPYALFLGGGMLGRVG